GGSGTATGTRDARFECPGPVQPRDPQSRETAARTRTPVPETASASPGPEASRPSLREGVLARRADGAAGRTPSSRLDRDSRYTSRTRGAEDQAPVCRDASFARRIAALDRGIRSARTR